MRPILAATAARTSCSGPGGLPEIFQKISKPTRKLRHPEGRQAEAGQFQEGSAHWTNILRTPSRPRPGVAPPPVFCTVKGFSRVLASLPDVATWPCAWACLSASANAAELAARSLLRDQLPISGAQFCTWMARPGDSPPLAEMKRRPLAATYGAYSSESISKHFKWLRNGCQTY